MIHRRGAGERRVGDVVGGEVAADDVGLADGVQGGGGVVVDDEAGSGGLATDERAAAVAAQAGRFGCGLSWSKVGGDAVNDVAVESELLHRRDRVLDPVGDRDVHLGLAWPPLRRDRVGDHTAGLQ